MKKILALLLALVMVFALAACGGVDDPTKSAHSPARPPALRQDELSPPPRAHQTPPQTAAGAPWRPPRPAEAPQQAAATEPAASGTDAPENAL